MDGCQKIIYRLRITPQLPARGSDFQIQPAAIRRVDRVFAGLGVAEFRVGRGMMRVSGEAIPTSILAISSDDNGRRRLLKDENTALTLGLSLGIVL